jgi:hypothetical protein
LFWSWSHPRLGTFSPVPPRVIEGLYSADFAYLQQLYVRLNGLAETECPACGTTFDLEAVDG